MSPAAAAEKAASLSRLPNPQNPAVMFFGTSEVAWVPPRNTRPWAEMLDPKLLQKGLKRKSFAAAIDQVGPHVHLLTGTIRYTCMYKWLIYNIYLYLEKIIRMYIYISVIHIHMCVCDIVLVYHSKSALSHQSHLDVSLAQTPQILHAKNAKI